MELLAAIVGLVTLCGLFAWQARGESQRTIAFAKEAMGLLKATSLEEKVRVESLDRTLKAAEEIRNEEAAEEIAPASFSSELMKRGVAEDEHGDKWGLG